MSVTQDYKIITLTPGECNAVSAALARECAEMQSIAGNYPPDCNFSRMVRGLLVDLESALAKVRE